MVTDIFSLILDEVESTIWVINVEYSMSKQIWHWFDQEDRKGLKKQIKSAYSKRDF